jgi:hypothetical protein
MHSPREKSNHSSEDKHRMLPGKGILSASPTWHREAITGIKTYHENTQVSGSSQEEF